MSNKTRIARKFIVTLAGVGATSYALSGCSTSVRDTVISGLGDASNSLATTFISAFFEHLLERNDQQDAVPTVKIRFDDAATFA
ncbi:MAG: hypothetical protein JNG88_06080 [Phycisphaerales bacterium]|nr:hypothetical protein [Phycisphaerales bacterium]